MRTRLTLTLVVEHRKDYDPSAHFVWYFADDAEEPDVVEDNETWEEANE